MKTIQVTQEDINTGMQDVCQHCPIALAIKRALKAELVSVYNFSIHVFISNSEMSYKYRVTDAIYSFIERFDEGVKVEPFSFNLEPL